jgi:hypothetical protein
LPLGKINRIFGRALVAILMRQRGVGNARPEAGYD